MNFSELFKHSNSLCCFSPDGLYLANAVQYRLIIRDARTLQILQLYTCLDAVQDIQWSSDSGFVLCCMPARSLVQVWSLEQPEWTCKIDEGSAGLVSAVWAPDARHVLSTSEFHLRITVWSLVNKSVSYIKYPKKCAQGLSFSPDGRYLAVAERRDCKDHVSVFACDSWKLVKHYETATEDLCGVQWAPDAAALAVWESCLQYKLLIYSLDGRLLQQYSAYQFALGIKSVSFAPSGQFLAIGSFDEKVRLLNHVTWRVIAEYTHPATLDTSRAVVYEETERKGALVRPDVAGPVFGTQSKYEVVSDERMSIPVVRPDLNKANPRQGVGLVSFSADSRFMATRNDNQPRVVWIWSLEQLQLVAVLIQLQPVKCAVWDPHQARLALCTGSNRVYMWSAAGSLSVEVPAEASFEVNSIRWHPKGSSLLLIGRENMCVCFLTQITPDLDKHSLTDVMKDMGHLETTGVQGTVED